MYFLGKIPGEDLREGDWKVAQSRLGLDEAVPASDPDAQERVLTSAVPRPNPNPDPTASEDQSITARTEATQPTPSFVRPLILGQQDS
jgi:hypothetical protein